MKFVELVNKYLELIDQDELRDAAIDLADKGVEEEEIVAGLAKLIDAAVPADVLLATLGPAGAMVGAVVERYDEVIAAALIRPMVRLAMDPQHRAAWKASRSDRKAARKAAREARRG